MLHCTFQHLRGISAKKELDLWQKGITSWEDLEALQNKQRHLFQDIANESPLHLSRKALIEEDAEFFAKNLPRREYYRIAFSFPEKSMFLDIETTGLSRFYDHITMVGWSLGQKYGVFIKGNDDEEVLRKAMSQAKVIVTFNGSLFDLPFLRQEFSDLSIPWCHVDLRFLAKRVGLSGGQKAIESLLGVKRPGALSALKSEDAPRLWYKYLWGETSALKQLIEYNHADIEGMKVIFDKAAGQILKEIEAPVDVPSIPSFSEYRTDVRWACEKSAEGIFVHPYRGKFGPTVSLTDLAIAADEKKLKVVGIDLTSNQNRPTGWCLVGNGRAITKRLRTNEELVQETIKAQPNLVSIDSPLSLPKGRTSVSDEDPGRQSYGIMRECERILKKRGINVYPSLITSMQRLTARGIWLADHFRSLGIPVIESYPGAAQDIMGIPRKRASLELLAKGLERFGIAGEFVQTRVSHDELDAITSAAVGLFFWSGKFEALGNDEEEYLIIPDVNKDSIPWRERKVVGVSGPIAAGKTTAARMLEQKGFHYVRFSLALEVLLREQGKAPSREALQSIGQEINEQKGQRWLCHQLASGLPDQGNIVIDGLRFPEDHAFCVETFGPAYVHIHISSPEEVRRERYVAIGYLEEHFSSAVSHPVERGVSTLASLAHIILENTGTVESFEQQVYKATEIGEDKIGEAT